MATRAVVVFGVAMQSAIARTKTVFAKQSRQPIGKRIDLAVRRTPSAVDDRDAVRADRGLLPEIVPE